MTRNIRRVRFNDLEQVQEIDTSFAMEEHQKDVLWYSRQDLQALRDDRTKDSGCSDCSSLFAAFGERRQKEFINELLRQQKEHRLMGLCDPKGLFQLSRTYSKKSKQDAVNNARNQAQEVQEYLCTPSREKTLLILDDALGLLDDSFPL
jgi:hypothetical protein